MALVLAIGGCGGSATSPSATSPTSDPNLTFCAQETNRYRAMVGRPALAQSSAVEAFAAAAAEADSRSQVPHGYYSANRPGGGAENEALNWSVTTFGSVRNTIAQAIAAFWSEGPGGGHYQNMIGPYSQVGCGLYLNGQVLTVVQEFR